MVFEFEARCGDYGCIYGSIERTGKCGDDEATDEMLVSVIRCEKREKFVHNACLLNYYCYLCGKLRKKLRMLRHGASQGNPKGLPCCHFIKSPSTRKGLTSPLSYIHTSFIAFGDCLCRAMICLRINLSEHPFVLFITIWSDCSIPVVFIRNM